MQSILARKFSTAGDETSSLDFYRYFVENIMCILYYNDPSEIRRVRCEMLGSIALLND